MNTVVVTGGVSRLGGVIASRLRECGWRVIATSHRFDAGADACADLAEPNGADRLFAAVLAVNDGRAPDALVNNAAVYAGDSDAVKTMDFDSPVRLMELMAGRKDGIGAVINVLDAECLRPALPSDGPYAASKCNLYAETLSAAERFAGVLRVNGVAPGPVLAPSEFRLKASPTPLGRPDAEAVADAVSWLLSAAYTTGCTIAVDGGSRFAKKM